MSNVLTNSEYLQILEQELIPALGCTEPIAIALASAKARALLGQIPAHAEVACSGNIVKNVKGVRVPNSDGQKGILIAAALGITGGDETRGLEVLTSVDDQARKDANELVSRGVLSCHVVEGVDNLYVGVSVTADDGSSAEAVISEHHTHFIRLVQNGTVLLDEPVAAKKVDASAALKARMSIADILNFVEHTDLADFKPLLDRQLEENTAISEYGLSHPCGAQIGRLLMASGKDDVKTRAKARAAAGSDARMSGCTLPVVINSGSGNQGLTVTMPVVEYAEHLKVSKDKLYRALLMSNLIAIHEKFYIGDLSAFCGAVSAGAGAGAAITYLHGGDLDAISRTVVNTLANVGGIVCDGAKASCAAKIASAVEAAVLGHTMSMRGIMFQPGDGLVQEDVEDTLRSIGYVAREGMRSTDAEILRIMTGDITLDHATV